ncbi:MAG: lipopolysaccharide heptosyltransferase II [Elusimicrobia bacterium]|nr:lipopolysaccharide heptosyltransferase II [Elusimicrobiota bacterium]
MNSRIMVRAPNWLGDAVMATPFLKCLAKKNHGVLVDVWTKPGLTEMFRGAPGVSEVVPLSLNESPWALARRIRARGYTTAYILPPSFSSALGPALAGVPDRIGYAADFRSPLLTRALPLDERFHYVRRYLGLIGEEGIDVRPGDLFVPRANQEETDTFLSKSGAQGSNNFLAVAPGSRAPARRWFPDRFAAVIDGLGSDKVEVLLMGAPEDRPYAAEVARLCRRKTIDLCGQTSVPMAASILSRCRALLTNESGLMHVGWAVGVPLVVVAGPSNPRLTSPFGPHVHVLQTREVPCVPCVRNECYRMGDDHTLCLKKISVSDVALCLSKLKIFSSI